MISHSTSRARSSAGSSDAWRWRASRAVARYLQVLREDSGERELLAKDLLINVTHFFRDPAAFDLLAETVVPELVRQQTLDRPLRIWVPGCSTGEEAYSIAMLFLEQIAAAERNIKLQVFASDIDADCVALRPQWHLSGIDRGRRDAGAARSLLHQGRPHLSGRARIA